MIYFLVLLLAVATVALWIFLPERWRRFRRRKLFEIPISAGYREILQRNVPVYRRLPPELREQLHGHVNVLLNEKRFAGCAGQQITDEIRVTIAGHASLLLLNHPDPAYFPDFTSILVYPDTYVADEITYDGEVEIHERVARAGESWHRGPVILSWRDIVHGISGTQDDGMNVILHEFAHKLDEQNGDTEGLPVLGDEADYDEWARVLGREFAALEESVESGSDGLLDDYALHSPAEFFAVATEVFFEKSREMKRMLPELYAQLGKYYRIDPAAWPAVAHLAGDPAAIAHNADSCRSQP